MAITLSHGRPMIYRSPAPSKQVLVGTIAGVVCMERDPAGPGWHVAHRALTDKHIHALLVLHPRQPELMFVASAQKGPGSWYQEHYAGSRISKSSDGGRTWQQVRHGLVLRPGAAHG